MANQSISALHGRCLPPFLDESLFKSDGGFDEGRFCATMDILPGQPSCCLPCPSTNWAYSDDFQTYNSVAEWLNVVGLILLTFMLVSYAVLPAQKTRSHYLSVCLIVAVMMICLGFTIPLGAKPDQCFDEITPNDMYSSMGCAWSGAFIVAGGLCAASWICIRALSMNLQICWDIVPGQRFFWISQGVGWGVPAALFTAAMSVTGTSFRFGSACHVNHENSMANFWAPLIAIAGIAGILQLATFAYCLHVYLKNLWVDSPANSTNASGSALPSFNGSLRNQTARAVYNRLKKVLWLQWRGIVIVSIIVVDVIFFAIVFVYLDGLSTDATKDVDKLMPWLLCLAEHPTDKDQCLALAQGWLVNEATVVAVLLLLSLAGVQVFLFLTRPSIFPAWIEFFRNRFTSRQEFVSLDAKPEIMRSQSQQAYHRYARGSASTTFEMQKPAYSAMATGPMSNSADMKSMAWVEEQLASPDETPIIQKSYQRSPPTYFEPSHYHRDVSPPTPAPAYTSPVRTRSQRTFDSTAPSIQPSSSLSSRREEEGGRRYNPPQTSFSTPKSPSRQSSMNRHQQAGMGRGVSPIGYESSEGWSRGRELRSPAEEEEREEQRGWEGRF